VCSFLTFFTPHCHLLAKVRDKVVESLYWWEFQLEIPFTFNAPRFLYYAIVLTHNSLVFQSSQMFTKGVGTFCQFGQFCPQYIIHKKEKVFCPDLLILNVRISDHLHKSTLGLPSNLFKISGKSSGFKTYPFIFSITITPIT